MRSVFETPSALKKTAQLFCGYPDRRAKSRLYTRAHTNVDARLHLAEAAAWLKRAQDAGTDRGVSYGADLGGAFLPSYPETTGYIIPSFLELARYYDDEEYLRRAIEMGIWETSLQLSCGAVMGGMCTDRPTAAVFNTGMVLLGYASLFKRTGDDVFAQAGRRAGNWLLEMQEPDGSWLRGNSQFADFSSTVYNVKAAWGLAEMGIALGESRFVVAAQRNGEYTISKQLQNGWFPACCLENAEKPLLHTIAYAAQGLAGIGKVTGRRDFTQAAARTGMSLTTAMREDGFIAGRFNRMFTAAANWCCLTGSAQTSWLWSELESITGDRKYGSCAERVNKYLMQRHDISSMDPNIRGGVAGSWPVWGPYGRLKVLNWATKFFVDALVARLRTVRAAANEVAAGA